MAQAQTATLLNTALSQRDRQRDAPDHRKVQVDGRSLAQLIAFAADYGALITFYNLDNQPAGDWSSFFGADEAVALAQHAALDLPQIEAASRRLLALARRPDEGRRRRGHVRQVFAAVDRLLTILDRAGPTTEQPLIRGVARGGGAGAMAAPLAALYGHLGGGALEALVADVFESRPEAWLSTLVDLLEDVLSALISELAHGVAAAQAALDVSLGADRHTPPAALWNAFCLLFEEARGRLNQFPRRLIDFYYGEVLQQHDVAARPDHLFLGFILAAKTTQASIPRGALFCAGDDAEGLAVNYAAEASLEVRATAVESLAIHRVTRSGAEATAPTGVLTGRVDLPALLAGDAAPFPIFGVSDVRSQGALTMKPASLGFMVSSPALMLGGGVRTITLSLDLEPASVARAVVAMAATAREDPVEALAHIIQADFKLVYSTAGGWMKLTDVTVAATPASPPAASTPRRITLTFTLAANAPPLVAVATPPTPGGPKPDLPADTFKAVAEPALIAQWSPPGDASTSLAGDAFAIISEIELRSLGVKVRVSGLDRLSIVTPNGPADPSQPMLLFGPTPARYAELDLAAPELFVKAMDEVAVCIRWSGLPVSATGFQGYYRGYTLDADGVVAPAPLFDNTSFRVRLSVGSMQGAAGPLADSADADPGAPWSVDAAASLNLFQTAADGGAVNPAAPVNATSVLRAAKVAKGASSPFFDPRACALRLTLEWPDTGFGHGLYANNLVHASMAQVRPPPTNGSGTPVTPAPAAPPPPLPNPPWSPTASSVTIAYEASAVLDVQIVSAAALTAVATTPVKPAAARADFLHLHPFEDLRAPAIAAGGGLRLIPQVETHAALYVSLSAPVPEVSLLFILAPSDKGWSTGAPQLQWQQLIAGVWRPAQVVADGSDALTGSGIVQLRLGMPDGPSTADSLRILALDGHQDMPLVKAVVANALTASWVGPGGAATRGTPLPSGSISKVPAALVKGGVGGVVQPMQSVGGSPLASGSAFHVWMAERLRHRGFAVDAWDYARLALEQTPSLWQAAVVPATDGRTGAAAPGQVWIVAVAGPLTPNVTDTTAPSASPAVLQGIGSALAEVAGAFVQITVTNPTYVRLTVDAEVAFASADTGEACCAKLEAELVRWLSPWPPTDLGARPSAYFAKHAINEFIRHRPYVAAVVRLDLRYDRDLAAAGPCYITSAKTHALRAHTSSVAASGVAAAAAAGRT